MTSDLTVRPYQSSDAAALSALYEASVRSLGARDYAPAQIEAWAALAPSPAELDRRMADGRIRLVVEQTMIQLLGRRLEGAVERAEVRDPAVAIQRLAAHHFPSEPEGSPYRRIHGHSFQVEATVRGIEGGRLGDFENAHLTPMYLWVWTLSRHLGWLRQ